MSDEIWLEKYRPSSLSEVQGNTDAISQLTAISLEGNIPNMILAGPPGIGKTSSILCLAQTLLPNSYKQAVIELNASDDRGIEVIRQTIKDFAQKKVILPEGGHKIIILDEADSLTEGAQQALRMIISDYAETTRFVLSCNDSTKIIDPIQSRCAILRFTKLTDKQVLERIMHIIETEKISYDKEGLEALIFTCEGLQLSYKYNKIGDMRQAINNLQATYTGFSKITKENVLKVCDIPNLKLITDSIDYCLALDFNNASLSMYQLWQEGFTCYDIVHTMSKIIQKMEIEVNLQYEILNEITILKTRVLEGLPTFLQISGFLAKVVDIVLINKKK